MLGSQKKGGKQKDLDSTPSWCLARAFLGKAVSSPMRAPVTNTTDGVAYRQEEFHSHSLRSGCHSVVGLVRAVLLDQTTTLSLCPQAAEGVRTLWVNPIHGGSTVMT